MTVRDSRRRRGRRALLVLALALVGVAMGGCRRVSTARARGGDELPADQMASASQVIRAHRARLAVVQTTWEEKSSLVGRWSPKGLEGTGLIVASDGRTALVLTSRHMVDPRFGRDPAIRTRGVLFGVRVGGPGQRATLKDGRLVAVYIHDADLALLRIGAPSSTPFTVPVAAADTLRAGDEVIVVGPPSAGGFVQAAGVLESFWDDTRLGSGAMQIRITDGRSATAGLVFTRRGGRLAGVLRGQREAPPGKQGDLLAVPADAIRRVDFWSHVLDEGNTRQLLARIR